MITEDNNFTEVERFYYPMDTSLNRETKENLLKMWADLKLLPLDIHDKLLDPSTAKKIKDICSYFKFNQNQSSLLAKIIRYYYFGKIRLEDFPSILYKEMGVDLNVAREISQIVIQKIINDNSQEEAYQSSLERISLPEALAKYPTTADQLITSAQIRIRGGQESVRPTIKNWLADYTYSVGYDAHSSIVRGNYLFQNENSKALSNNDRQKLTYILKSYDEKTPVTVDATRKQIIFPAVENAEAGFSPVLHSLPSNNIPAPDLVRKTEGVGYKPAPAERIELTRGIKPVNTSRPAYSMDNIQSASLPAKPQYAPPAPAPQNNLEQNYEHYHIPQKPAPDSLPLAQTENLKFSSPQKLPFEKEKEKMFSAPAPTALPIPQLPPRPSAPQTPPQPAIPEKAPAPIMPEPLHIHPASSHDEDDGKEQLPRNVVNLRE